MWVNANSICKRLEVSIKEQKTSTPRWNESTSNDISIQHARGVIEGLLMAKVATREIEQAEKQTSHVSPTPGDTYCNFCGLEQEFWEKIPNCPCDKII